MILKLKKYKVRISTDSAEINTLQAGDIVNRQYFDGKGTIYTLMYVDSVGVDVVDKDGVKKDSPYFIGQLIYGDEPKTGELLNFVRVTSLSNSARGGALYLTSSDSDSPYMDVIDVVDRDNAVFILSGTGGMTPPNSKVTHIQNTDEYFTEIISDLGGDGLLFSVPNGASKSKRDVVDPVLLGFMSIKPSKDTDMEIFGSTFKLKGGEYNDIFIPLDSSDMMGSHLPMDIHLTNIGSVGDSFYIKGLIFVSMASMTGFSDGVKVRVGQLSGVIDEHFGALDSYGAYFQKLYATKDVNIAGTLSAGSKDGQQAVFYVGKIRTNAFTNSLKIEMKDNPAEKYTYADNPVGIGEMYRSKEDTSFYANKDKLWHLIHAGSTVCFSMFVMSLHEKESVTFNIGENDIAVKMATNGWNRVYFYFSLPEDAENTVITIRDADVAFCAPQLEFGVHPTIYQPTDEVSLLDYSEGNPDYGMWAAEGGIGGTMQNPLLKLNADGKGAIESKDSGFKLNADGSGHLGGGAISFSKDKVNISLSGTNMGAEVDSINSEIDKAKADAKVANDKIDGLEIGGRNYFNLDNQQPKLMTEPYCFEMRSTTKKGNTPIFLGRKDIDFKVGDVFILSYRMMAEPSDSNTFECAIRIIENNITRDYLYPPKSEWIDGWVYCEHVIKVRNQTDSVWNMELYNHRFGDSFNPYIRYEQLKLEKSNKKSDWSPAPEDQQAELNKQITSVRTDFDVVEGKINMNVAKTEQLVNQTTGLVEESKQTATQVNQTAEEIKTTATKVTTDAETAEASATKATAEATKSATNAANAKTDALSAKTQATNAQTKALEAAAKAEEALASAGESSESYLKAKTEAELAVKEAEKATEQAILSQTKADLATEEAAKAKAEADKAALVGVEVTKAKTEIIQTAEEIKTTATKVTTDAEKATDASLKAQADATKATKEALDAATKAEEALASAGASSQSYLDAKAKAEAAAKEAANAKAEAAKAQGSADEAAETLVDISSKQTEINQTAEEISSKATMVEGLAASASKDAESAQLKAKEAADKAAEAQLKAKEALESAGASSAEYKKAKAEAEKAVAEADKAADSAVEANAALGKVIEAETNVTQTAEEINITASKVAVDAVTATKKAAEAKNEADKASLEAIEATKKAEEALASAGVSSAEYKKALAEANKAKAQAELAASKASEASSHLENVKKLESSVSITAEGVSVNAVKVSESVEHVDGAVIKAQESATSAASKAAEAELKAKLAQEEAEKALNSAGESSASYLKAKAEADKAAADALKAKNDAANAASEAANAKNTQKEIIIKYNEINETAEGINIITGEVKKAANEATEAADKAQAQSSAAKLEAEKANADALKAAAQAEEALASAGKSSQSYLDAKAKADEAAKKASDASDKATQAASEAKKAEQEAIKALNAQEDVSNKYTEINKTADEIKLLASKAETHANKAVEAEASINLKADGIVMEASQKASDKAIDGLEIGGRNIIINSGNFIASDYWTRYTGNQPYVEGGLLKVLGDTSGSPRIRNRNVKSMIPYEEESVTWMLSFVYRGNGRVGVSGKSSSTLTEMNEQGGQYIGRVSDVSIDKIEDGFVRHVVKIETLTQTDTRKAGWLTYAIPIGEVFEFKTFKLEKGTKPTDWSPAPEDVVEEAVSKSEAKLTVTANEIRGEVNANKVDADGKITGLNTRVTQTEDKISQTVTKKEYDANNMQVGEKLTKIEQDVDGVEIIAKSAEEKIDGLEIGDINFVLNSNKKVTNGAYPLTTYKLSPDCDLVSGDYVQVIIYGKINDGRTGWGIWNTHGNQGYMFMITHDDYVEKRGRYEKIVKWIKTPSSDNSQIIVYPQPNNSTVNTIERISIKRGNIITDWTPNPADIVQESVTKSEAKLIVTANEIRGEVNANKVDADGKITGLNTRVTQTEESITSKVSQTEYDANNKAVGTKISAIEQKSDSIELSVKNLGAGTNIIKGSYNWLWQASDTGKNTISSYKDSLGNHVNKITISEASSRINRHTWLYNYEVFEKGEFYTVSFEYRTNISDANMQYYYRHHQNHIVIKLMNTGESWAKASGTFQIDKNITTSPETWKHLLLAIFNNPKAGETLEVRSLMLERGMTATGYTPAWQDYGASLALTKDGITMIGSGGISLIGKVTFNMMAGADPNDYGTIIEGGTIKTKYLNAQQIVSVGVTADTFKGKDIIVDTGNIGGWNITDNTIENTNIVLEANGGIRAKNGKWVLAQDGSAKFTSGEIGGWNINNDVLESDSMTLNPLGGISTKTNLWALNADGTAFFGRGIDSVGSHIMDITKTDVVLGGLFHIDKDWIKAYRPEMPPSETYAKWMDLNEVRIGFYKKEPNYISKAVFGSQALGAVSSINYLIALEHSSNSSYTGGIKIDMTYSEKGWDDTTYPPPAINIVSKNTNLSTTPGHQMTGISLNGSNIAGFGLRIRIVPSGVSDEKLLDSDSYVMFEGNTNVIYYIPLPSETWVGRVFMVYNNGKKWCQAQCKGKSGTTGIYSSVFRYGDNRKSNRWSLNDGQVGFMINDGRTWNCSYLDWSGSQW